MIHPNTELRYVNDTIGYGVFAKERIKKGSITYIKDSLEIEISPEDYLQHNPQMQGEIEKYSYIDERGYRIISWDFAKYVNHCCKGNSISTGYGFEIALRDILPGEQITDEYGAFNLTEPIPLSCRKHGCRKVVMPEDFDLLYPEWDEKIREAFKLFRTVPQPLLPLLDPTMKAELDEFLKDERTYRSIYQLRYRSPEIKNRKLRKAI